MKAIRANANPVLGIREKGVRITSRMGKVTYTWALSNEQVAILKDCLSRGGFDFQEKEHTIYSAKRGKLNVTVYRKGPKVLVQGKETEEFVKFIGVLIDYSNIRSHNFFYS